MASWILVPCLVSLRNEFNLLAPGRDKGADGSIGDSAHTSTSDHTPDEDSYVLRDHDADSKNEVHALDIDSSGPWPRPFASIVADIVKGERAKWLDADDVCRLEYVIFNRKIYSRSRDFQPIDYTGSDPHTNHAHFSARYLTASENDTRPWGVLKGDTLSAAEVTQINNHTTAQVNRVVTALNALQTAVLSGINNVPAKMLAAPYGSTSYPGRTLASFLKDEHAKRDWEIGDATGAKVTPPRAGAPLDALAKLPAALAEIRAIVAAGADVDEKALGNALAPSLAPLILAGLPEGTLTVADVEEAVRSVLTHGVG